MSAKKILLIILCVLMVIIALQNTRSIDTHILFWEFSSSRIILILGSVAVGIGIGLILPSAYRITKKKE
jgi:uncharacterized integral membrane protein